MSEPLKVRVMTPEGIVDEAEVRSLVLPGLAGDIGVRRGHARLILGLKPGPLVFHPPEGEPRRLALDGGIADVTPETVTVLAAGAARPESIHPEEAARAVDAALMRLEQSTNRTEHARALAEFDRALVRLRVVGEDKLWERARRKRRLFTHMDDSRR